jgi:hypothetical protein
MIKPTMEHLNDPYVIQLIETISKMEDRIEDLEEGACRFNCATRKKAFMAGHQYGYLTVTNDPEADYKEWRNEQ